MPTWPTCIRVPAIGTLTLCASLLVSPAEPLQAQGFPSFGGLEVRLGTASPENAETGFGLAADLDLGGLGVGTLRVLAGLHHFSTDIDRVASSGDYSATGGRLGLRLDPLGRQRFSPFIGVALTAHSVAADVDDPVVEDLLDGFYAGGSILGGASYDLDVDGRYAAVLEIRRTFASNIDHTSIEVGLRWHPRGAGTYSIER